MLIHMYEHFGKGVSVYKPQRVFVVIREIWKKYYNLSYPNLNISC